MSEDVTDLLAELSLRLYQRPEIAFALLFGSQATGRTHAQSDIDLAVFVDPELSARQRFDLRLELVASLSDLGELDVTMLNDAPALLGHRAMMGTKLFIRDRTAWVRYFVRTFRESEDERFFRRLHHTERRRRLEAGTFGRP